MPSERLRGPTRNDRSERVRRQCRIMTKEFCGSRGLADLVLFGLAPVGDRCHDGRTGKPRSLDTFLPRDRRFCGFGQRPRDHDYMVGSCNRITR